MDFSGNPANIPQLGFTHSGRFHADDVFSAALLQILRPDIRIHRGFAVPKNFSGIVFDIGDGPFDHHKKGSPRRPNGAAYAAFGLLWREYGHHFLPPEAAKRFDDKFVQPLDIDDNTGTGNPVAALVGAFNPPWDSNTDLDTAFFEAVEVAQRLLKARLDSMAAVERAKPIMEKALQQMQDNVVVLDIFLPWKPVIIPSPAEFVIYPSDRGGYSVQCVPKDFNGKTGNKIPMPGGWRGKPPEELPAISGIPGLRFCHASGFMCVTATLEDARTACARAREIHSKVKANEAARKAAQAQENGTVPKEQASISEEAGKT